jgi:hypothetical protein
MLLTLCRGRIILRETRGPLILKQIQRRGVLFGKLRCRPRLGSFSRGLLGNLCTWLMFKICHELACVAYVEDRIRGSTRSWSVTWPTAFGPCLTTQWLNICKHMGSHTPEAGFFICSKRYLMISSSG